MKSKYPEVAQLSVPTSSLAPTLGTLGIDLVDTLGAKGDGVADDTAKINLALASGKPYALRPGANYLFTSALTPVSGSGLICPFGRATLTRAVDNIHGFNIGASAAVDGVVLKGFDLKGRRGTFNSVDHRGILVPGGNSVTNLLIEDVGTLDWQGGGIMILGTPSARNSVIVIRGGRVDNSGYWGVVVQACNDDVAVDGVRMSRWARTGSAPGITVGRGSVRSIVRGCFVIGDGLETSGGGSHGISLEGDETVGTGYGTSAIGNFIDGLENGYGIEVSCTDAQVIGNLVRACGVTAGFSGIVVDRVGAENTPRRRVIIDGNTVEACFGGIYVKGVSGTVHEDILIANNDLWGAGNAPAASLFGGIYLDFAKNVSIKNNRVRNFSRSGIRINTSSEIVVALNEIVENNQKNIANPDHYGLVWRDVTGQTGRYLGPNLVKNNLLGDVSLTTDLSTWAGSEWYGVPGLPTSVPSNHFQQWLNSGVLTQVA